MFLSAVADCVLDGRLFDVYNRDHNAAFNIGVQMSTDRRRRYTVGVERRVVWGMSCMFFSACRTTVRRGHSLLWCRDNVKLCFTTVFDHPPARAEMDDVQVSPGGVLLRDERHRVHHVPFAREKWGRCFRTQSCRSLRSHGSWFNTKMLNLSTAVQSANLHLSVKSRTMCKTERDLEGRPL